MTGNNFTDIALGLVICSFCVCLIGILLSGVIK